MIGHLQIIECRKRGLKPSAVFVEAGLSPAKHRFAFDDPEQAIAHDLYPTVWVHDMQKRHDFRFLTGCIVHIHAVELNDDVLDLADRIALLAKEVILCDGIELMTNKNGEWVAYANAS